MTKELSPKELADGILRQLHGEVPEFSQLLSSPLWVWEDLIEKEPEKAWLVFLELLGQSRDDDTLEQIKIRLKLLLWDHYDAFHTRVKELVQGHDQLPRFLPDESLARERFEVKERTDDEIIEGYLENYRHFENVQRMAEK